MANATINDQLTENIFNLSRTMRGEMTFNSEVFHLTVVQIQTLVFIKKKGSVSMSDVASQFKITLPTATVMSDKLVNFDLIQRQQGASDRRVVNISLTEKGENLLKEAMKQRHQKTNKLLSYLSVEDRKQLLRILKNLSANIQKNYEK